MTVSLAWLRRVSTVSELVLATDSRLGFGCRWDCCPKLLALPRGDAAICFAGNTMYAYPVLLQVIAACQHPRLLSRAMDLDELKGYLLRVLNNMVSLIHHLPIGGDNGPDGTTFLLAGWSWKHSRFKVWLLHYDKSIERFTFRPTSVWTGLNREKLLAFTGDYETEFKERLVDLLRSKGKLAGGGFDMEPLEVLRDMLRDPGFDLIGGAPQVLKIYKYCSSRPYAVFWPNKGAGKVSLLGRPLLEYEQSPYLVLDTDEMKTEKHTPKVPPCKESGSSGETESALSSNVAPEAATPKDV
jgi:hypothetical protein